MVLNRMELVEISLLSVILLHTHQKWQQITLEAMVQDVNAGQVAPEERLSDHVYMYDSQAKELVLADKMEERQAQRAEAQKEAKAAEQVCSTYTLDEVVENLKTAKIDPEYNKTNNRMRRKYYYVQDCQGETHHHH